MQEKKTKSHSKNTCFFSFLHFGLRYPPRNLPRPPTTTQLVANMGTENRHRIHRDKYNFVPRRPCVSSTWPVTASVVVMSGGSAQVITVTPSARFLRHRCELRALDLGLAGRFAMYSSHRCCRRCCCRLGNAPSPSIAVFFLTLSGKPSPWV